MAEELRQVHLDARQIRVLAHPLRARLLGQLRLDGPATATMLASKLRTNTGATSYHLRQLAEAGLVEEDRHASHGRERWWRSAHDMTSWHRDTYAGDPDATAAADWLASYQMKNFAERAAAWQRAVPHESAEWREAARVSDYYLTVNPGQLDALLDELDAVVDRYRESAAAAPPPDGRQVLIYLAGLPRMEP